MDETPTSASPVVADNAAVEQEVQLKPAAVGLELVADPTLGYAAQQNAVPVLRALTVTNQSEAAIENLEVHIACSPGFADGARLRFDRLAPAETRCISPIDLRANHAYLADLQESVNAEIRATAISDGEQIGAASRPIDVLAYDQWAGTRSIPELLAAFCMPNNPAVDQLIAQASELLRSCDPGLQMDGYQSKSRDVVWKQVSALYSTICAQSLHYAEPPASFGSDGQKIRTPDRILEARVATCLDLAMLFASCLEQAGLRPVVLLKKGHAWVGVWLHKTCFADPLTDDVQAIRKRVVGGEFLTFETTGVASHPNHRPSLRSATAQGAEHLDKEDEFAYAVDIARAREVQIKPLPSRIPLTAGSSTTGAGIEPPKGIEATPDLPDLDPALLAPIDVAGEDTPAGRLAKWKSKLLDLTLRNKLLNFKPTKSTLQFIAPDLGRLEDALSEGKEFSIKPLPSLMEGADPRMAAVHTARGGRAPVDDMALEALEKRELLSKAPAGELDGVLLAINSAAKTGLEEGGANTLYLALGLLRWTETERAESAHVAPILLVPMTLQRQSVRSGFRLTRHDDEAIINPTLLQMLRQQFQMNTSSLETIVADEKGIDVPRVFQCFRMAVRDIKHWEVIEQAHLGIFSFTKYLMWKDLHDRTEQLKANRVVKHLIENPGQVFPTDELSDRDITEHLDDAYQPQELLAPLLSDSSQLRAICAVNSGRDLVLEGPPGTGKSQTITNLIAHNLAKGKTVLFVSEKAAALDVVHRRLEKIGLGPFCLELHSSKTKKAEVLRQLEGALNVAGQRTAQDWEMEAQRLAGLRQELNSLVASLHRVHRNGLTAYDAIGACVEGEGNGKAPSAMPWADSEAHTPQELDQLRQTARRMSALAGSLSRISGHELAQVGCAQWSPSWQDSLLGTVRELLGNAEALKEAAKAAGETLALDATGRSLELYQALDALCDLVLGAPKVPSGLANAAHDESARARIASLVKHGQFRSSAWQALGPGWGADLARLPAHELKQQWSAASSTWWPKSVLAKRSLKNRLAPYRVDGKPPSDELVAQVFEPLGRVNEEDRHITALESDGRLLLADAFNGVDTKWDAVAEYEQWAQRFSLAVLRVAGPYEPAISTLRNTLKPLVSENRALLAASAQVGRTLARYRDAWRSFQQTLSKLEELAVAVSPLYGSQDADGAIERVMGVVSSWQSSQRSIQPWCNWRHVRESAIAQGLQGLVQSFETGEVQLADGPAHFEFSYRAWWLKKVVDNDPVLRTFSGADHARKIAEFRAADAEFQKLTERYIAAKLAGNVPAAAGVPVGAETELGRLRREMQKQRGHTPVRQLVRGLPTLLPKLKPCLLMSPLSVAQYLDAGHTQFDLVVFDEASQIPVWDAVGAIARGKQLVVVGDPKQLPPTNFFNKSSDTEGDSSQSEEVQDLESILDECLGAGMNQLSLQWHYRSRNESLITFSNVRYYDSGLITFPSPLTEDKAVQLVPVSGVYDRGATRTNRKEAEAVVEGIEKHYLSPKSKRLSLGVVTFNQPQQALIETLLDERRRKNVALDQAIAAAVDEPLFVKNLENVQGDERDVIFFSITFGADSAGKTTMNFGPLNGEGGHRRLNVAISRARESKVIFSSLRPEQIDVAKVRAAGVRDLKNYLEFAIRGPRALVEQSLLTGMEPDSPFERAVIKMLRDRQWEVHPQVGCSDYRIDIGVVDPNAKGRYLLGVECDGATYHSAATARDRDRLRQHVLEGLGWRIHRIWSTSWWMNPQREMDELCAVLEALRDNPQQAEAPDESEQAVGAASDARDEQVCASGQPNSEDTPPGETSGVTSPNATNAPIAATNSAPTLRVYTQALLPEATGSVDFYSSAAAPALTRQLAAIADQEGPVSEAVMFRRVARAWNLGRTGSRIVERLQRLVPSDIPRTEDEAGRFYWPRGAEVKSWRGFRVCSADEASRRAVDEVCLEELGALAHAVLLQVGASPRAEVARSVCRMIGVSRMTVEAEQRISQAIDRLARTGLVRESEGAIRAA